MTDARELEMMVSPDRWPVWPLLPLKRTKEGKLETGFLVESSMSVPIQPKVWLGTIYQKWTEGSIEYQNFEELLADGWIVD